jgi:hypothetical protein
MNGVVLRAAMTFVAPDQQSVAMSAAVIDQGLDGEQLDAVAGLQVTAMAQVSMVADDSGRVVSSMFMTKDELARAIVELRAIHDAMDTCAKSVDRGWQRYRDAIRIKALEEGGGV